MHLAVGELALGDNKVVLVHVVKVPAPHTAHVRPHTSDRVSGRCVRQSDRVSGRSVYCTASHIPSILREYGGVT